MTDSITPPVGGHTPGPALPIAAPYRLKRVPGVRRVERDPYGGWIARDQLGNEITEPGFRWNTRSGAWHVALEADIFGPFPAKATGVHPHEGTHTPTHQHPQAAA